MNEENPLIVGELKILRSRSDETVKDLLIEICKKYYVDRRDTDNEHIYFEIYNKREFSKYSSPVNPDCFKDCEVW